MMNLKQFILISILSMALSIVFGAFGAHALKNTLTPLQLEQWQTGVFYHMTQSLGLLIFLLFFTLKNSNPTKSFKDILQLKCPKSFYLFLFGIIFFSFGLYLYALTGIKQFALIVPIGGINFILAWVILGLQLVL